MLRSASSIAVGVLDMLGLIEGESTRAINVPNVVNSRIETTVTNSDATPRQIDSELQSLFVTDNWEQVLFRNKNDILRLPHDDFVNLLNENFDLSKALLIRKYFLDMCLERIIEREELRIKQRVKCEWNMQRYFSCV